MQRENEYIMRELDLIYSELKGPWQEIADLLIEKHDQGLKLHWTEVAHVESIINLKLEGRI